MGKNTRATAFVIDSLKCAIIRQNIQCQKLYNTITNECMIRSYVFGVAICQKVRLTELLSSSPNRLNSPVVDNP